MQSGDVDQQTANIKQSFCKHQNNFFAAIERSIGNNKYSPCKHQTFYLSALSPYRDTGLWRRLSNRLCSFPSRRAQFGHETLSVLHRRPKPQSSEHLPAEILIFSNHISLLFHPITRSHNRFSPSHNGQLQQYTRTTAKATASTQAMTPNMSAMH